MSYCLSLMKAVNIPIIWEAESWISFPDTESIILQLTYIYDQMKNRQCSLTPAQGSTAGITAGPNGEMLVVGLVFADSRPINSKTFQRRHKTVLLGSGKDSLPMLPIDIPITKHRFYKCNVAPKGLVSSDIKLIYTHVVSAPGKRAISERSGWNPSGLVESAEERLSGSKLLHVLRTANSEEQKSGITGIKTINNSPNKSNSNLNSNSNHNSSSHGTNNSTAKNNKN